MALFDISNDFFDEFVLLLQQKNLLKFLKLLYHDETFLFDSL
jgi:hypothetical protein